MLAEQQLPPLLGPAFFLLALAIMLLSFAFWIWMLTDCIKNELPGTRLKVAWTVFIVVFGVFGAFCYNVGRRNKRIQELGR